MHGAMVSNNGNGIGGGANAMSEWLHHKYRREGRSHPAAAAGVHHDAMTSSYVT